jgi:hypothetical protein
VTIRCPTQSLRYLAAKSRNPRPIASTRRR